MPLRICHFSDWHGQQTDLPWADTYFCTGDMLNNYPKYAYDYCEINKLPWIERHREIHMQAQFVRKTKFRRYLGNPEAPVYIVPGNHDFVHLSNMFDGGPTFEFDDNHRVFELQGIRIGGFRGVSAIGGNWNDEMTDEELHAQIEKIPSDIEILLTHAPPHGILDKVGGFGRGPNVGIKPLPSFINKQTYQGGPLRMHCFGHIHEQFGSLLIGDRTNKIRFSNAATGYIVYDWEDGEITVVKKVANSCGKSLT